MQWTPWRKFAAVTIVALFLLIFPLTRRIIWLILPLGSGADDILFVIVVAPFVAIGLARLVRWIGGSGLKETLRRLIEE